MNYKQANNLLDDVREGANYSVQMINKALELTGDLDPDERLKNEHQKITEPATFERTF